MHCGSEPEWISGWEIDYNCVAAKKRRERRIEDAFERSGK
jgi:hypothetical protein